jgi:hypothetical protein
LAGSVVVVVESMELRMEERADVPEAAERADMAEIAERLVWVRRRGVMGRGMGSFGGLYIFLGLEFRLGRRDLWWSWLDLDVDWNGMVYIDEDHH